MITEDVSYNVNILASNVAEVQQVIRILQDDVEISKRYVRWIVNPGDDLSAQPERVQTLMRAALGA